jgi:hypothetical protein
MRYCFGDCAHHPAGVFIITQLAKLCIFFIIFPVVPRQLIDGTCKITQTLSDTIQQLYTQCFGLSGVAPVLSVVLISFSSHLITVSLTGRRFLATAVSLST